MNEPFDLPVTYKGKEMLFPARLEQTGYTHRFLVEVEGVEVVYEPDEERNYRAIADPETVQKTQNLELLKAIAEAIEAAVK